MKGTYNAFLYKKNDKMPTPFRLEGASTPTIDFYDSDTDIYTGALYFSTGDAQRRLAIKQFNIDQDSASTKYADAYYLPSPAAGLTADKWYELVSTKNRYQIFPVGHCIVTSTKTNPSSAMGGGTWELIDKKFTPLSSNATSLFTVTSANCSLTSIYVNRADHSIRIRLQILPKVTFGDSSLSLGTFNMSEMGISNFWNTWYPLGSSDGAGGISLASIAYDTGVITHLDSIHQKGNDTDITSTEYNIIYDFTVLIPMDRMLDSACNQFIWKRTA